MIGVESVVPPLGPQTISPPPFMPIAVVAGALTQVVVVSSPPLPESFDRTDVSSDEQPTIRAALTTIPITIAHMNRASRFLRGGVR